MKNKNLFLTLFVLMAACVGIVWAADHIDAPAVTSKTTDITDYFAFESPQNPDNMVFVCNVQGLLDPMASSSAKFDEQVMVEFNIDNSGDNTEDLVIQAFFKNDKLQVYGPIAPSQKGLISSPETGGMLTETAITSYNGEVNIGTNGEIKVFAGPRDDPFFFDFAQFNEILAGNASGFKSPGSDTFAGTNVLSVVVEVPKSMLGSAATLNTWVEAKRKI